ncbi:helix-turn-helix transcriptional regulator [Phreatobacter sp. AB_2022a]|uniref:helix-turn-helix transcriptional regulator n=1 Tax=Phreatobacter sp. AB_2022a TaxID=3003134 RepID=UPI0022874328|nr:helix-turn-helix transcriptional regulator [Phreatobacter sp. AB_2022a]MCZ0734453.1 helix-turn-helix transcriptional regulator [Phreatobacter sp. AB_2022a]
MSDDSLAEHIYEAAFNPPEWIGVLDGLGAATRSAGGCMVLFNGNEPLGMMQSEIIREIGQSVAAEPDPGALRCFEYLYVNRPTGFIVGSEFFPEPLRAADGFRRTKLGLGLGDDAVSLIFLPSGETAMFSIDRSTTSGPFRPEDVDRLNAFYPHLSRAALVSARLRLEQAKTVVSTLDALGLPAAVLGSSGVVRASNPLLEGLADRLLPVAFGGMAVAHPSADKLFQEAVRASRAGFHRLVRSIPVPAVEDKPPLVLHVLPLRRSAYDIFQGADTLVAVTTVSPTAAAPSASVLTGLFDLSPAEVRLASALTEGRTLRAAAAGAGITYGTARRYLESIFAKTGVSQQSQLVALLISAHALGRKV